MGGLISEAVIKSLRSLKYQGYSDTFMRLIYTAPASPRDKATYPEGTSYPCRFVPKPSPDVLPGAEVELADGELFFSREVTLSPRDRVRMTKLHGDVVEALDYHIVAGPVLDSLGKSATLQLVRE